MSSKPATSTNGTSNDDGNKTSKKNKTRSRFTTTAETSHGSSNFNSRAVSDGSSDNHIKIEYLAAKNSTGKRKYSEATTKQASLIKQLVEKQMKTKLTKPKQIDKSKSIADYAAQRNRNEEQVKKKIQEDKPVLQPAPWGNQRVPSSSKKSKRLSKNPSSSTRGGQSSSRKRKKTKEKKEEES